MASPTPHEIWRDAHWLAQAFDPSSGLVRLVEMNRADYRAASFLDDRLMQTPVSIHLLPLSELASAMPPGARRDARWIFHIGHVGSTLVARLLGELDRVLAVREPRLLRDLTGLPTAERTRLLQAVQALYSRVFEPNQIALVKATSFVSEMAADLVPASGRALMLTTSPETYVATILAGENSCRELRFLAPTRAARVASRVPALAGTDGDLTQLAVAAWACEATAIEAAAAAMSDRAVLFMDFDSFLGDMQRSLRELAVFFGFEASDEAIGAIAAGPVPTRYSKAMEYDYSPALRAELLEEARQAHCHGFERSIAQLDEAARTSPLLTAALARSRRI
jgi:hypothetical protein